MGSILKKMRSYGFVGTIRMAFYVFAGLLNRLMFNLCKMRRLQQRVIVFESESDFTDNAYALYTYMYKRGYFKRYKAIWLVDNLKSFRHKRLSNTIFLHKQDIYPSIRRSYYLATAKYYLFDHNLVIAKYKRRKGQQTVYLSHGSGFKMMKGSMGCDLRKYLDWHIVTGPIAQSYEEYYWNTTAGQMKDFGVSRNDLFFKDLTKVRERVDRAFHFSGYNKIVLWMPTFRKSKNLEISEDYENTETSLPLFDTMKKLKECNAFLAKNNALMVLKVHHLSVDLPIYKQSFSNILILNNNDISKAGVQLYEFVACTDILLTDYSSISIDYLLLDRPMIFTLDDYEAYAASRGLYPDNAKDYMPGHHVYTLEELFRAFEDTFAGKDTYKQARADICPRFHTYRDGNASKRLIDFLQL